MIGLYLLTLQKQTILAWNYNEKMKDFKGTRTHLEFDMTIERVKLLIAKYPKVAIKIWAHIGTSQKILDALKLPLKEDILVRPYLY